MEFDPENPFTAKDFYDYVCGFLESSISPAQKLAAANIADLANKRFRELLAKCPTVFGQQNMLSSNEELVFSVDRTPADTHSAKLWNVKEIKE